MQPNENSVRAAGKKERNEMINTADIGRLPLECHPAVQHRAVMHLPPTFRSCSPSFSFLCMYIACGVVDLFRQRTDHNIESLLLLCNLPRLRDSGPCVTVFDDPSESIGC